MASTAAENTAALAGWSGEYTGVAGLADSFVPVDSLGSAVPQSELPAAAPTTNPWNFTVAPEDVSWSTSAEAERQKVFGTNAPPVTSGSRGMRDLTLSNCLLEGFTRGVHVEDMVVELESLINYSLNTEKGFVNIPVYHVTANSKHYGDGTGAEGGFFIIKDIKVKESMRDLAGNSTRTNVDVSFIQVPAYQVDSGRDQASQAVTGSKAAFPEQQADQGVGTTKSKSGPNGPTAKAQTVGGVNVPAGSTNVQEVKSANGKTTVSYTDANGIKRKVTK